MNSNKVKTSCKRGFTLIELLVVVLIIGILAAVAVPQYQRAVYKNRYAALMAIGDALIKAEEVYFLENGQYTDDFEHLLATPAGCTLSSDRHTCVYPWGECHLRKNVGRISCVDNTSINNGFAWYFKTSAYVHYGRVCWSLSSVDKTTKWAKLCQAMGATRLVNCDNCRPYGSCCTFSFQK